MNIVTVEGEVGTNTWTWTCPDGRNAKISWLHCAYTSDATVGNRQILLQLLDASDVIRMDTHAGAVQAASLVRHYLYLPGIYRETSFIDGELEVALPRSLVVPSGYKLKVYDSTDVSASDAMAINFQYEDLI